MFTYSRRFIGANQLPRNLSEFDVELFFKLLPSDIEAIRDQFKQDHRLGPALQLVFLRASGRPLERIATVPKTLLRHLTDALNLTQTSIASLRSIYRRQATLYAHQRWARAFLSLENHTETQWQALSQAVRTCARDAATIDELVTYAEQWLYDVRCSIPSDRALRDLAREAYGEMDRLAIETVQRSVPKEALVNCQRALYQPKSAEDTITLIEWLKAPMKRHGPSSLNDAIEKITVLRSLGVHEWRLNDVSATRQRMYAKAFVDQPPSNVKRRKGDLQTLQMVCFLIVALHELTDNTIYVAGRRITDLVRQSTQKVKENRLRSANRYRHQLVQIKNLVRSDALSAEQKVAAIDSLIEEDAVSPETSMASMVRRHLVDEAAGIKPLLNAVTLLDIRGTDNHRSVRQWQALHDLGASSKSTLPHEFDVGLVDQRWRSLVEDTDRKRALRAFEVSTLLEARKGLRSGRLWIDHSFSFKGNEQMFVGKDDWAAHKTSLFKTTDLPLTSEEFLTPLLANIEVGLKSVAAAIKAGKLEIDGEGNLRLPALEALPDEPEAKRTREAISNAIGPVQLPELLLQADAHINFSEALLGRKASSVNELTALYGGMIAHGTENDARGVAAMIPPLQASQITAAMRALEAPGRLRRANLRVLEFQRKQPSSELWGPGTKGSADMMSLDASRHLYVSRVDPRRRTFGTGIYTRVLSSYGVFYDQPIVHNERQGSVAVNGTEEYNQSVTDRDRVSLLAVDTHGYTNVTMTVAKALGFDLCPQLRNLAERKLHLPRSLKVPEEIDGAVNRGVSLNAIKGGWDELLRRLASIRTGKVTPALLIQRMGSAASDDPACKAADQLGRLLRTLFLCDYFSNEAFRREIHTLLNRGESVHQLQRAIYYGRIAHDRGRRTDEMKAISGSHALLTNIVIAWNTAQMQNVVDRWKRQGQRIDENWLRRIGPVGFSHINFKGIFTFGVGRYADALVQLSPVERYRATNGT